MISDTSSIIYLPELNPDLIEKISWDAIDLIIMELFVRGSSSLDWVSVFRRKKPKIPIILVTSNACKNTCISALNMDVDRIYEKPITPTLLQTLFEEFSNRSALRLNHERKAVYSQNRWVDLTSTEYKILETLKIARRRMTRAELQLAVWPNAQISENNLDTHLTNLKRKIPELNQSLNVKRGLGYYLEISKN